MLSYLKIGLCGEKVVVKISQSHAMYGFKSDHHQFELGLELNGQPV